MIDSSGRGLACRDQLTRDGFQDRLSHPTSNLEVLVDADLDTHAVALYVRTDDLLRVALRPAPRRPAIVIVDRNQVKSQNCTF